MRGGIEARHPFGQPCQWALGQVGGREDRLCAVLVRDVNFGRSFLVQGDRNSFDVDLAFGI